MVAETDEKTKYTRVEFERRFLLKPDVDWKSFVEPYSKRLEDKYLTGTRLRLRVMTDLDTGRQLIKLTKKAESPSPYFRTISRILLDPPEFELFNRLDGHPIRKVRYYFNHSSNVYSLDVFEDELDGLLLSEVSADSLDELMLIEPPPFVLCEVTEDQFFDGGELCKIAQADLKHRLQNFEFARP
jgi:CYTH domain-containing protein